MSQGCVYVHMLLFDAHVSIQISYNLIDMTNKNKMLKILRKKSVKRRESDSAGPLSITLHKRSSSGQAHHR